MRIDHNSLMTRMKIAHLVRYLMFERVVALLDLNTVTLESMF